MDWVVDTVFTAAVDQLAREERRLAALERPVGTEPVFDHDGFAAINRALSYVVMGGVLEALMRALPAALAEDVMSLNVERERLPVSLLAVIEAAAFRQSGNDNVASLIARAEVLGGAVAHANDARLISDFSAHLKLADGQTISEKNFQALWLILGLDGDWRGQPNDLLLLKEIREKRNDIAHWEADPVVIGRSKTPTDLRKMLNRLIDLLNHVQLHIWYWLEACQ
jgi:hypothetical protein